MSIMDAVLATAIWFAGLLVLTLILERGNA